jgi:FkbM family methyltransferase
VRKILIDVGGYHGESSRAALDPRFGFKRIYCFEPVRSCYEHIIENICDPRMTVFNAGLLDRSSMLPMHQAGSLGGSVYADAPQTEGGVQHCEFIEASTFFSENIGLDDRVWMKLNCEGAECDIMLNLFKSGEATKLTEALIDFDAAKIPSARGKVATVQALLENATFSYHYPEEVQYEMVTNFGGIRNWLIVTGASERGITATLKSFAYQSRCLLDPSINGYYKIRLLRLVGLRRPSSVPTMPGSALQPPWNKRRPAV